MSHLISSLFYHLMAGLIGKVWPRDMLLSPGTVLCNRYVISKVHEQGAENAVYLAYDKILDMDVAIKENWNRDRPHQDQFQFEASLLATLDQPYIPKARDYYIEDGFQFFVMDFVEGINLRQLMQRRRPGTQEILDWAAQLCDILGYLHSLAPPVIHRDIEPGNIILAASGQVFLVDFGFAKIFKPEGERPSTPKPSIPGAAGLEGTVKSDPQKARLVVPLITDRRSDQYSLAATLYALLTGAPPLDAWERISGKPTLAPIHPSRPDLSPFAEAAILKALSLDQNRRFSVIEDFQAALRE